MRWTGCPLADGNPLTHRIRKKELNGTISEEARKLFTKLKGRPEIAETISARGLPAHTTLHKVYATTGAGPRRLLFFCRHAPAGASEARWVLVFYRNKSDAVGRNMSPQNKEFIGQLAKNLQAALQDISESTPEAPKYEII